MAAAPLAPVADPSAHQNPEIPRMQEDPEISAKKFLELGRSERHAVKTCEPGESTAFNGTSVCLPGLQKDSRCYSGSGGSCLVAAVGLGPIVPRCKPWLR